MGFYDKNLAGATIHHIDFDFNLRTHPVTKDIILKTNEKAIMQALRNCVLSANGEFVMENDIGGGVDQLLFENNQAMLIYNTKRRIEETINNHERRIELQDLRVYRTEDRHGIVFEIVFFYANSPTAITEYITVERRR